MVLQLIVLPVSVDQLNVLLLVRIAIKLLVLAEQYHIVIKKMVLLPTVLPVSVVQQTNVLVLVVCIVLFYRAKRILVLFIHNAADKMVLSQTTKIANVALKHVIQLSQFVTMGTVPLAVIVEAMTDNRNRTASTVRSTFAKNGGNLGETGSVGFMFERTGEVVYAAGTGDADAIMMAAIEAGAEDVDSSDDRHVITCADSDLNAVASVLESELGESMSTKLIWKPTMTTELDLEGMQKLMKLIDALEDDDDVQRVTSNFEVSDAVMNQL